MDVALIAAEKTGRKARLIELDPRYVDATVMRWQNLTGKTAVNPATGARHGATNAASEQTRQPCGEPSLRPTEEDAHD